uniref:Calcium uniporter protein n=1 Tax=Capra hircus TaxID=9925 RepID=A0A8C2PL63_CAPHI
GRVFSCSVLGIGDVTCSRRGNLSILRFGECLRKYFIHSLLWKRLTSQVVATWRYWCIYTCWIFTFPLIVIKSVHQRLSSWPNLGVVYCSTVVPSDDVTVVYQNGLPVISVRLPSRRERCQFTLKPISDSVGVFLRQLQEEDRGIDRVAIYSPDGVRVAASTGIDLLLLDDFKLVINDLTYHVRPPKRDLLSHENAATLNDVKTLVQQLYTTLCIEQHQLNKERELIERLEDLKEQLAPLEKVRIEISRKAEKRTTLVLWGGLAYMATQFGILARLTWWEYSWDIMEPVTYFITYGSAMAMYAYFVMTRQEYVYPEARDRQYLLFFHKGAKKSRFDLEKYNELKDAIAQVSFPKMKVNPSPIVYSGGIIVYNHTT